ncbi:MAG: hypothetical protein Q4D79_14380 [Propionibacteriaceae bacterium]|nr:hypothetical protein [Propionibacteriaceae bacterium]
MTLTEDVTALPPGVSFGDPVFSGEDVTDGGADTPSATVLVMGGGKTVEVTLTNPVEEPQVATPVAPTVTAGVCAPGATTPSDPVVSVPVTEGVSYGEPQVSVAGGKATVTAVATPEAGKQIDSVLPEGWVLNQDGTATFTTSVTVPACQPESTPAPPMPVTPISPKITPGVCAPGAKTPSDPTVEIPTVPGLTYGDPKIRLVGNKLVITVDPRQREQHQLDGPAGWLDSESGWLSHLHLRY